MSTDTQQIRRDIERTREDLRTDVDALTDRVSPSRVVGRRVDRVRGAARSVREKIMGTVQHPIEASSGPASALAERASSAAGSVGDAAGAAQQKVLSQTQGSPLAAGLIAFGAGVLISSLIPASEPEQRIAGQLKDTLSEHAEDIKAQATEVAGEVKEHLREPVQQAVESVKASAGDAASTVREETGTTPRSGGAI
ncbi:hypothetical protein CS0771_63120 [Catellatospora sp. IY07-71]|uniref:DUF3618 domain-containing protein n=1 Tax=Catellatospora sp. IY07-71 TaxID=2728827 RepID=UPI001BB555C1|nr:DUF3618 domain-containing protein [Catellatospora sp. IY07-71]BCJ76768.1 hypothetical protein CS0771_63120 [Catellatospora sp. IY07-71]